ncbi:hypothetical protein HDE_09806 [Halotydeus destructor]|nr:hypothetical protein HDE_09806 [Halotydeus destructor]
MKSLLIASMLLVLANCHESLDGIIDSFLKVHDGKYGLRDEISKDFTVGKDTFLFQFTPYGRSHVRRTTPATVTTGASGPVVRLGARGIGPKLHGHHILLQQAHWYAC